MKVPTILKLAIIGLVAWIGYKAFIATKGSSSQTITDPESGEEYPLD